MAESGTNSLSWNNDTSYALGLYRIIGSNLGIWPLTRHGLYSRFRFFIVLILLLIMTYNLIGEFVSGCISIFDAVDFIGLLAANTVSILKVSLIRLHGKKMNCIVESAIKDWSMVPCGKSRDIMRGHARLGRFVTLFQLSVAYLSAGLIIIGALPTFEPIATLEFDNFSTTALRNLPMSTGCSMIDMPNSLYFAFYFLQFIQLLCLCCCNFGCDSLFFGISMHLSAQFELLKNDVARLGEENEVNERIIREEFAVLIERHNHLNRLVNLVEDTFHIIILGQLAASGLHISLLGIQMLFALRDHFYTVVVYTPTGISLLLLQLCMYSYVGDYLASQTKAMRDAAYSCSWYNFSPNLAKDVMFVIMRSNGTFQLTAGKVFRMNIEGFTRIVKTMVSFFSVIKISIIG